VGSNPTLSANHPYSPTFTIKRSTLYFGKARWMGMGPLHTIGLAEARRRAGEHRLRRHDGIDPIEARRRERLQARADAAKSITFKECAEG
jgi:hypothetical protein